MSGGTELYGLGGIGRTQRVNSVEAITEVSDHLEFALTMVRRVVADQDRLTQLTSRIRAVEARVFDDRYYLAVIGEFSSGKSTFINALLGGGDLLPTSALRTTAAATRILHGPELGFEIRLRDDERRFSYPSPGTPGPASAIGRRLLELAPGAQIPDDTSGMLALVVTDERIASQLEELVVHHPASVLRDGMVIIDTPGTNAEAGHTEITGRVMREEADLAAVLTPATAAAPVSLTEFLKEALTPALLNRCTFLVTKMDNVDEEEHDDLLKYVRKRLARNLDLEEPVVEGVSAEPAVRIATGRPLRGPEQEHWANEFPQTVRRLRELMQRHRIAAISEALLSLLEILLSELEDELGQAQWRLGEEEERLRDVRIPDLTQFVHDRSGEAEAWVAYGAQQARATASPLAGQWQQYVTRTVLAAVDNAPSPEGLHYAVHVWTPQVITTELARVAGHVQSTVNSTLGDAAEHAVQASQAAFRAEYEKLDIPQAAPVNRDFPVVTADQLARTALEIYAYGTASIGMWPDLNAMRNHARAQTHQTLQQVAVRLGQQIDESVGGATARCRAVVRNQVDLYRAAYEQAVADMADEHQRREEILAARRNLLNDAGRQTAARRAEVGNRREQLSQRSGTPPKPLPAVTDRPGH